MQHVQPTANILTLHSYNIANDAYFQGTPDEVTGMVKEWIDQTLSLIPSNAKIFEIGSGTGRDAKYIETQGFLVHRSDACDVFVQKLNDQGYDAVHFNPIEGLFPIGIDLIFANAVLLHFNDGEMLHTLQNAYSQLISGGILSFTVKFGQGEGWTEEKLGEPRWFRYWEPLPLQELVASVGFEIVSCSGDDKWIQIIARKHG